MSVITYPLCTVTDDSGAIVTGASVTIASITDKAGTTISNPGATLNQAGSNISVDYDAEVHGEAWITLAVAKNGSTITNLNASPTFYLTRDSSRTLTALPASGTLAVKPAVTLAAADVSGTLPANAVAWGGAFVTGMPLPTSSYTAAPSPTAIAAAILATPANLLVTDATGKVGANNLPADYQQRGVAVTLPTTAPSGYGGTGATPQQIAAFILATPTNLLATDGAGRVTTGTNADKTGYALTLAQSFNNTGQTVKPAVTLAAADVSGSLPANAVQWGGAAVTGMPLPTSSYTAPPTPPTTGAITSAVVAGMATAPVGSVAGAVGSVGSGVTVATNTDKTGYALTSSQAFNNLGQTTKTPVTLAASDVAGNLKADVDTIKTQSVTAAGSVTFPAAIGTSTYAGGAVASVASTVNATLVSTGLDAIPITAPTGPATTFRQMVVQSWRRWFKPSAMTLSQLKTYADDGSTVITTQTVGDDGTTQSIGAAS